MLPFFQNPRFGFYFLQLIAHRLLQDNERLEMELAHYRSAPVVYRPQRQRALSRPEKFATLRNESRVVRHIKLGGCAVGSYGTGISDLAEDWRRLD